jgi:iron complex outermembrane receptor protein
VTYADVESGEGELLTGRPEWQGGVSINLQWLDNFSTYISANYVGESTATSLYTGDFSVETLSSYSKFDISANYRLDDTLNVDFYITNALDKNYSYAVGFSAPERGLGIKLIWQI